MVALAGGVAALVVLMPGPRQEAESTPSGTGYLPPPEREQVAPSTSNTHDALAVAAAFVQTAVARRHVDSSWKLVTPAFRQGYSRATWAKGEIPVVPFPVNRARWRLDYSYPRELGFQVSLYPPPRSDVRATAFNLSVKSVGSGSGRHWLVDSFTPDAVRAPGGAPLRPGGLPDLGAQYTGGGEARLGSAWLLVPIGVIGLAILLPLGFVLMQAYRSRKARHAYLATRRP